MFQHLCATTRPLVRDYRFRAVLAATRSPSARSLVITAITGPLSCKNGLTMESPSSTTTARSQILASCSRDSCSGDPWSEQPRCTYYLLPCVKNPMGSRFGRATTRLYHPLPAGQQVAETRGQGLLSLVDPIEVNSSLEAPRPGKASARIAGCPKSSQASDLG